MSSKREKDTKVLIVGGGYGGIFLASKLQKIGIGFTLVDPKTFFHHNMGALRGIVKPEFTKVTMIPYAKSFGDSFVQGKVESVDLDGRKAKLEDGRELSFTHLVMATGSEGAFPARTEAKTLRELEEESMRVAKELKKSKKVLIIGGGSVGVELAGEIRDKYPQGEKEIVIINSGTKLLSNTEIRQEGLHKGADKIVRKKGVEVKLGERVSNLDELVFDRHHPQTVQTTKGSYEADMVFKCTGLRPASKLLIDLFGETVNDAGRVRVTPELRVSGLDHRAPPVFAIGDCCDTKEEKMAAHAETHANLVAKNIKSGAPAGSGKTYKPKFVGMMVTVGSKDGICYFNGRKMPKIIIRKTKGKDFMAGKYWSAMKQKMPK